MIKLFYLLKISQELPSQDHMNQQSHDLDSIFKFRSLGCFAYNFKWLVPLSLGLNKGKIHSKKF
jgi:hypothetical protein